MSVYGAIYADIWHDKKFRGLDVNEQKLFLYLLSSPHKTMIGYYHLPLHYAIYDLGWDEDLFNGSMNILEEKGMAFYDHEEEIVFVKNFFRYNRVKSITQVKGLFNQLGKVQESDYYDSLIESLPSALDPSTKKEIKDLFWKNYRPYERALMDKKTVNSEEENIPYAYPMDRVSNGYGMGMHTPCITVSESVTETETESVTESERSLSLEKENKSDAPEASQDRKPFLNFSKDQNRDQKTKTGMSMSDDEKAFRLELMKLLFPKSLYNSDVGEAARVLCRVLEDSKRALSVIEGYSVEARSPDDMAQKLWRECNRHVKEAVT